MVGRGGLEPPTSRLSGVRSNHLSYRPIPIKNGGARRDRTDDLLNANQALSQLSYGPMIKLYQIKLTVVGLGRLELPTSRLSGVRSNQLSYIPDALDSALSKSGQSRSLKTE